MEQLPIDRPPIYTRFLACASPNPSTVFLALGGWGLEMALLACVQDNIYHSAGWTPWLVAPFLLWFWLTMSWVAWGMARMIAAAWRQPKVWLSLGVCGLLGAVVTVVLILYLASWGLYLQTGRFMNWEAIQFFLINIHELWLYFWQQEVTALAELALGTVVAVAVGIWFGRRLTVSRWPVPDTPALWRTRRLVWYGCGILWLALLLAVESSTDLAVIGPSQDTLRGCLNPAATLTTSLLASLTDETVEPCLDPAQLRPLSLRGRWDGPVVVGHPANVIFLTIESMRSDAVLAVHQGHEIVPCLNDLARRGVHLTRTYSQTTHTDYSTVSLFSSLFPLRTRRHLYFHPNDPWPKTLIYDVLKKAGYATAIISSQNQGWGGMDNFLQSRSLDLFYDPKRAGGAAANRPQTEWADNFADAQTADAAISWIRGQAAKHTPFFLGINFQGSHFPYTLPAGAEQIFTPATIDFPVSFQSYAPGKTEIVRNAYDNALHECDRQLGRVVDALRECGQLDNTILFVCGDHGQAFHEEDGYVTHAREPIEPVIRTAGVLFAPKFLRPATEDYPVELIDIVPTVLALLGLPAHPNFQGIDVLSEDRPPLGERLLFFHTENPLTRADAVLLAGRWKYVWNRRTSTGALFDVQADPNETDNLIDRQPALAARLGDVLGRWRQRQLAYYYYPAYYQSYYPPAAPSWRWTVVQAGAESPPN